MMEKSNEPGPTRMGEGFNPHVLRSSGLYLFVCVVFGFFGYFLMTLIPELSPSDPDVQVRFLAGKATVVIAGMAILNGLMQLLEIQTNGNLLGKIVQSPIASAIYAGCQLMCATALWFCY